VRARRDAVSIPAVSVAEPPFLRLGALSRGPRLESRRWSATISTLRLSASSTAPRWSGLHCFDDPAAALVEAARILRPGGRLIGSCFVLGRDGLRQRFLVRSHTGDFGPIGTQGEIESWLASAGFKLTAASRSGPMLFFEAAF